MILNLKLVTFIQALASAAPVLPPGLVTTRRVSLLTWPESQVRIASKVFMSLDDSRLFLSVNRGPLDPATLTALMASLPVSGDSLVSSAAVFLLKMTIASAFYCLAE